MTIKEQIQKEAGEYANNHFEGCRYPYTDDLRITDYDKSKNSYIAGATKHAELNIEFAEWIDKSVSAYDKGFYGYTELYELFLSDKNKEK